MEPMLGEIRMFAFNGNMKHWMPCAGQILPIQQYTALFSLLGTQFGGDGHNTFALPDLRGRVPVHAHRDSLFEVGETGGDESVGLSVTQIPPHTHAVPVATTTADSNAPAGKSLAVPPANRPIYSDAPPNATMGQPTIGNAGRGARHENMQPFTVIAFHIATSGYFPERP